LPPGLGLGAKWSPSIGSDGAIGVMTDASRATEKTIPALDAEDRAWLDEQLRRYTELLSYLREH
jgi:hypothetical protein